MNRALAIVRFAWRLHRMPPQNTFYYQNAQMTAREYESLAVLVPTLPPEIFNKRVLVLVGYEEEGM
jgi:hypothetical protein